jgi:hypothetical protein
MCLNGFLWASLCTPNIQPVVWNKVPLPAVLENTAATVSCSATNDRRRQQRVIERATALSNLRPDIDREHASIIAGFFA